MGRPKIPKCGECKKSVTEKSEAVQCDLHCNLWFHIECIGMPKTEYVGLKEDEEWYCEKCSLKDSNNLLKTEIQNLTNIIDILQADLNDNKSYCDNLRKQNNSLNEIVLEKELEIVKLKEEMSKYEEKNRIYRNRTLSNSARDFHSICPAINANLNLSNRFSCLSMEEDPVEESKHITISTSSPAVWNPKRSGDKTGYENARSFLSNEEFPPLQKQGRKLISSRQEVRSDLSNSRLTSVHGSGRNHDIKLRDKDYLGRNVELRGSCTKHKVLIMADSYGKNLAMYLNSKTSRDKYDIFSICRPSARLENVLCELEEFAKEFTMNDTVVIIGGSNNVSEHSESILTENIVSRIVGLSRKTNVILATLPSRFDRSEFNDIIHLCNVNLIESLNENVEFLSLNKYQRNLFTTHGQHLNKKGKYILCTELLKIVEGRVKNRSSFLE